MVEPDTQRPRRMLLIEDDSGYSERLRRNLETEGFEVDVAASGAEALDVLRQRFFDLVVTDIKMPDMSGVDVLRAIRAGEAEGLDPDLPVVALTSVNTVETAVEAMKLGAADYISKEAEKRELLVRLRRVLDQSRLLNENRLLRAQVEREQAFPGLVGRSEALRRISREIQNVAPSDATVLISGETGVGKELVARALHQASPRRAGAFLDVNCAALPDDNLFQSEVFGHERGAFTGAVMQRKGRFELAAGGTLFFDEIAELSRESQAKVLKAIELMEITRLGGSRPIRVDCRLICATNKDLEEVVRQGGFREDLYYR
ncbi:MAG: sigma-54 dependent transcriptional regulator, partial [Candidatus Sumerlaeota bacterium]|nr:sigma-54 dependent transcriptional regulator [Candidatus Sumerlaeota bacterium]